jgi:hypothetical protein
MNKDIVAFTNAGLIDSRMWSTFGVSVKDTESAIGQFGTGLKYAIAVLMREDRSMRIVSGGVEYIFGTTEVDFRGKGFKQITCNGEPLPFTTHLGGKWELWMAYRELYSNCLDEGGDHGDDGDTVIYAELGDIRHEDIFLDAANKKVAASSLNCTVYCGQSNFLFYKGVRVKKLSKPSLYTYDLKQVTLTEDRTIKTMWEVPQRIASALSCGVRFAEGVLLNSKGFWEEDVDFEYLSLTLPDRIVELVGRYRKDSVYMQNSLKDVAISQLGAAIYSKDPMDERQQRVVSKASEFCEKIGYPIRYPVHLSLDLGRGVLGMADTGSQLIYLSDAVLDQGVKQVAATLIEENIHIQKGYSDETYEMQNYLFDQIVTMGEKLTGDVL